MLAHRSGYSPFHFHRAFSKATGETPKQYVERMRLERAAYLLAITDERVLAIALSVGFSNHETFSRAFARRFRLTPARYRAVAKKAQADRLAANASLKGEECALSKVWFGRLPSTWLLTVRNVGPYEDVPPPFSSGDRLWSTIASWARAAGVPHEPTPWVISHDDPTVTPGPKQRLDACLKTVRPVETTAPVKLFQFAGGAYAGAEHLGPHETLIQGYRHVADGIRRSSRHEFGLGPPIEILRHIDPDPARHRTEIYFPVVRK